MKKAFLALAAVALLFATSCKKESVNPAVDVPEGSFLATIDNGANPQNAPVVKDGMGTMTTIDGDNFVIWENGDEISINNSIYTTTSTPGNTVVFSGGNATGTTFHAFFPASIAGTDAAGTLPATQTIELDGNNNITVRNLPMYATSTNNQLTFHNICAALKVKVPAECDKVIITAHENICGTFNVTGDGTQANPYTANITSTGADTAITAQKNSGKFAIDEVIYIAIPAITTSNFTIKYVDGTDVLYQTSLSAAQTFEVNKVYNVKTPIPVYFTAQDASVNISYYNEGSVNLQYMTKINGVFTGWNLYTIDAKINLPSVGDRIYFRASSTGNLVVGEEGWFESTGKVTVAGNIMCLLNGTNPGTTLTAQNDYAFNNLFTLMNITDASMLQLPATTLSNYCYANMFERCTLLTSVPMLPARTLANNCYSSMFSDCYALTSVPSTLLPADTLAESCYDKMFNKCSFLTSAPALPATTLKKNCYSNMFDNCRQLTSAIVLPATQLTVGCYRNMFKNADRLNSITILATDASASNCLTGWLNDAGSSATDPTVYCTPEAYTNVVNNTDVDDWTVTANQ